MLDNEQGMSVVREGVPSQAVSSLDDEVPWSALDMLLALVAGVLLGAFLFVPISLALNVLEITPPRGAQFLIFSLVFYLPLSLSVWFFGLKRHGASWSTLGFRPVGAGPLFAMAPALLGLMVLNMIVGALVTLVIGEFTNPQEESIAPGGVLKFADFVWLFVTVALIAPVAEELMFRGMLYRYLRGRMGVIVAAVLSATVFAVAHVIPVLLPLLFTTGIVLALITERYKSILPAIVLHGLSNGAQLALLYLYLNKGS